MSSRSQTKAIIAMKGHPFTRKSQFAAHIAASLKCQLLSLEDFLDVLNPHFFEACPCKPAASSPQDVAFQIICQIAKSHLSVGLFKHVIIDSRLSSRSHLDQLIELASSLDQTRLVIIECKADNIYECQTKFQQYLESNHSVETREKWYKPKNWEDVEKAIQDGYDERSDGYNVSKLVLDPILDYQESKGPPPFIDAVQHMITRDENEGPDLVVYQRWRQSSYLPSKVSDRRRPYFREMKGSKKIRFCSSGGGHYLGELGLVGHAANCIACKDQVNREAYTCKSCSFALHKDCAELLDDNNKPPMAPSYQELSDKIECWADFDMLLGLSPCRSCEEGYNPKSYACDDCFFGSHLQAGVFPTVIRNGCDEHLLCVVYGYLNPDEEHFGCKACGDPVSMVWYSCRICGVAYHYSCLTEIPVRVEHEHGLHHHHMLLQYSCQEEEDYLCLVCFENEDPERRDPSRWFYSCEECEFVAHLRCIGDGMLSLEKYLIKEELDVVAMGSKKPESGAINQDGKEKDDKDREMRHCKAGSGHNITNYVEKGLEYEAECRGCDTQLAKGAAAYTCEHCSFALHKECAELVSDHNKLLPSIHVCSPDSVLSHGYQDFIQDSYPCCSCKENSSPLPCGDCLFTAHLKHKLLPTVIRHDCHPHFLSIMIRDLNPMRRILCDGCGNRVDEIWYTCKMCGVDYDYDCLTKVAVRMEHQHHHQQHLMLIQYCSSNDAEDSLCNICLENGDLETLDLSRWFYSCQDCTYEAHLKCIQDDRSRQDEDASSVETNYGD